MGTSGASVDLEVVAEVRNHPAVVARPTSGGVRFRRNCWLAVMDGALVANDRQNRRHVFFLDGSEEAPRSHRLLMRWPEPSEHHFLDGRGESVVVIANGIDWEVDEEMVVAETAGLIFDGIQDAPPLRDDCARLEDSTWAELPTVFMALSVATVMSALGKFGVLDAFPWAFVAFGVLGYALIALLYGGHLRPTSIKHLKGQRARSKPGARNRRKRRKRRLRRRG